MITQFTSMQNRHPPQIINKILILIKKLNYLSSAKEIFQNSKYYHEQRL